MDVIMFCTPFFLGFEWMLASVTHCTFLLFPFVFPKISMYTLAVCIAVDFMFKVFTSIIVQRLYIVCTFLPSSASPHWKRLFFIVLSLCIAILLPVLITTMRYNFISQVTSYGMLRFATLLCSQFATEQTQDLINQDKDYKPRAQWLWMCIGWFVPVGFFYYFDSVIQLYYILSACWFIIFIGYLFVVDVPFERKMNLKAFGKFRLIAALCEMPLYITIFHAPAWYPITLVGLVSFIMSKQPLPRKDYGYAEEPDQNCYCDAV